MTNTDDLLVSKDVAQIWSAEAAALYRRLAFRKNALTPAEITGFTHSRLAILQLLVQPDTAQHVIATFSHQDSPLVHLARSIIASKEEIPQTDCYNIAYTGFRPEDLRLAVQYYAGYSKQTTRRNSHSEIRQQERKTEFLKKLRDADIVERDSYTFQRIRDAISDNPTANASYAWNEFRLYGLQPRAAELAFARVVTESQIRLDLGADQDSQPVDQNLLVFDRGSAKWDPETEIPLPPADFMVGNIGVDVKSNVFQSDRNSGLRGFLIDPQTEQHVVGLVVISDDNHFGVMADWIGLLYPSKSRKGSRVLPFSGIRSGRQLRDARILPSPFIAASLLSVFDIPGLTRHSIDKRIPLLEYVDPLALSIYSDTDESAFLGPYLMQISNRLRASAYSLSTSYEADLVDEVFKIVLNMLSAKESSDDVRFFLSCVKTLVNSHLFPVRPIRLATDSVPLFHRWIQEVVDPILQSRLRVLCLNVNCKSNDVLISDVALTAGGAARGTLHCNKCRRTFSDTVILTHCKGCGRYPLLLGENTWCPKCQGLICEEEHKHGQQRCLCEFPTTGGHGRRESTPWNHRPR